MIKNQLRNILKAYPLGIMSANRLLVVRMNINKSKKYNRYCAFDRVTIYFAVSLKVFNVNIIKTCQLIQNPFGTCLQIFLFFHKPPHQRPLAFLRLKISFDQ